jgi:hypothetical protein
MSDRRSQRIREQLRQHSNPRSRNAPESLSFAEQMRRAYLPAQAQPVSPTDSHSQLARQLESRRSGRR